MYTGTVKQKNPAAVALGKLGGRARAQALSPEERSRISRLANKARNKRLSATERRAIAQKAIRARWEKAKKKAGEGVTLASADRTTR